jgi:hypothetical protein
MSARRITALSAAAAMAAALAASGLPQSATKVVDGLPLHARHLYDEGEPEVYVQGF